MYKNEKNAFGTLAILRWQNRKNREKSLNKNVFVRMLHFSVIKHKYYSLDRKHNIQQKTEILMHMCDARWFMSCVQHIWKKFLPTTMTIIAFLRYTEKKY